ncbi:MAG: CHC2 zinc finger domain-containing protein [Lachnospiraceae bacterium]|nr:CHC2 zinc finger domain-containing protein [Lachnospiraceae bacterium]
MFIPPFSIADVSDLLGIERVGASSGTSFGVVCPFCGDRRGKMNFCISKDGQVKNTYHCYKCGESGNMLQLYAKLSGLDGADACKQAYRLILDQLTENPLADSALESRRNEVRDLAGQSSEMADLQKRDAIYREMLSMLHLEKQHAADLMLRGLTSGQVAAMADLGFKSTAPKEAKSLARRLLKRGFSLDGLPGFYVDDKRDWTLAFYGCNKGILCPAYSVDGKIAGFQIRMDHPFQDRKYTWLSSSGKRKGCSAKSPVGFFGNADDSSVFVTEGILKAAVAHLATGKTFLGNPGVGHYRELRSSLEELKSRHLKLVFEAYDMDKLMRVACENGSEKECQGCEIRCGGQLPGEIICPHKQKKRDDIRAGCNRLYEACGELSLRCIRLTWEQDADGLWTGKHKGIDDWQLGLQTERAGFMRDASRHNGLN